MMLRHPRNNGKDNQDTKKPMKINYNFPKLVVSRKLCKPKDVTSGSYIKSGRLSFSAF